MNILGFAYVALSLLVTILVFEIRKRWKKSVARKNEIKRLVKTVAQQEALFEASINGPSSYWPTQLASTSVDYNLSSKKFDLEPSVQVADPYRPVESDLGAKKSDFEASVHVAAPYRPVEFDSGSKRSDFEPSFHVGGPCRPVESDLGAKKLGLMAKKCDFEPSVHVGTPYRPIKFDSRAKNLGSEPFVQVAAPYRPVKSDLGAKKLVFEPSVHVGASYRPVESDLGAKFLGSRPKNVDFVPSVHVGGPYRPVEFDSGVKNLKSGNEDLRPKSLDLESGNDDLKPNDVDLKLENLDMKLGNAELRPVQYECALCFSPATTRCSRCKVVRYCSGKCQILHWREGHKNECQPFTANQPGDMGGGFRQKVLLQQEGCEVHQHSYESVGSLNVKSVQKLEPNCFRVDFSGNKGNESECLTDRVETGDSSADSDKLRGYPTKIDHIACSDKLNQINTSRNNHDTKSSSGSNGSGTTEFTISDPYIPFSGFWEGAINSGLSKVNSDDVFISNSEYDISIGAKGSADASVMRSSVSTNDLKDSNMKSLKPPKANQVIHGRRIIVDPVISKKNEILATASVVHLPPITERHSFQYEKNRKHDNVDVSDAGSGENSSLLRNSRNGFKTSMQKVVNQLLVSKSTQQSVTGSEITERSIEKGLFPYDLFVKLYNWKKVELLQPRGLLNCGNSCYANVVLQCLACTPPLTAYLLQGLHSKACKWEGWCFTCEFQSLMLNAKEGNSPMSPAAILSQIYKIKSHFGNGKEEDAHEFLRYVIDTMQSVTLKEAGVNASGSLEEETSFIGLTFGGYLRSKIKCMKCGIKSEQHERMMDLTVEIEGDVGTLEEALRRFTSTEILDGDNKYHCSRCRSYEKAKKKFRVLEAPNVLTIALKRFQSDKLEKLNKWIRFPEILDLAPFVSGTSDKSPIYRLYGVIVHLDSMNATYSGHYVCFVKNADNKWFKIDDSRVMAVDLESVLANRAYMLLYARCSPRAPKLIRNLIACDSGKSKGSPIKSRSHTIGSWTAATNDPLHGHCNGTEPLHPINMGFHSVQTVFEDDSFSESASSIFSEECSGSTESSNRDYSSTDDYFDSFFGNFGTDRIYSCRNASDSETSSSSSSSASLSPIYSTGKSNDQVLDSDSSKINIKVGDSSSCRVAHSKRLGWANPFRNKKSGLVFRRSVREKTI